MGKVTPLLKPRNTASEAVAAKTLVIHNSSAGTIPAKHTSNPSNGGIAVAGVKQSGGARISGGSV